MGHDEAATGWAAFDAFRPRCVSGFEAGGSTSLKWGADGELTPLDLHGILARLSVHDAQISELAGEGQLPLT